jgi:hypothetical protein
VSFNDKKKKHKVNFLSRVSMTLYNSLNGDGTNIIVMCRQT